MLLAACLLPWLQELCRLYWHRNWRPAAPVCLPIVHGCAGAAVCTQDAMTALRPPRVVEASSGCYPGCRPPGGQRKRVMSQEAEELLGQANLLYATNKCAALTAVSISLRVDCCLLSVHVCSCAASEPCSLPSASIAASVLYLIALSRITQLRKKVAMLDLCKWSCCC